MHSCSGGKQGSGFPGAGGGQGRGGAGLATEEVRVLLEVVKIFCAIIRLVVK